MKPKQTHTQVDSPSGLSEAEEPPAERSFYWEKVPLVAPCQAWLRSVLRLAVKLCGLGQNLVVSGRASLRLPRVFF